jgi:mRNA-degrading endonuclease RelE of RelBE toxin-antitoxin system
VTLPVYRIEIAAEAFVALEKVTKKTAAELKRVIDELARDPSTQGKPLGPPLENLRSVRAARARYRVLYRVEEDVVTVVFLGPRRPGEATDVYAMAQKIIRSFPPEK